MTSTAPIIGYIVVSKLARGGGRFDYIDVSPLYPPGGHAELNRQRWLERAAEHPVRYQDAEFIIAEVRGNA